MHIVRHGSTARSTVAGLRRRRGVILVTAAACFAVLLTACDREDPRLVDSTSGAIVMDSAPPPDDTLTPPSGADSAGTTLSPTPVPIDTTGAAIADDELRALAARLIVPVQGVRPDELHDTYAASRGGGSRSHEALDILAPRGTPVLSATDGILRKFHDSAAGGLMVYAGDASDRFVLMYGHLDRYADGIVEGQPLRRGQVIGYVGTTGNAPAGTPHLHFAIARGQPSVAWWRGTPVDPYPLLTGKAAPSGGR